MNFNELLKKVSIYDYMQLTNIIARCPKESRDDVIEFIERCFKYNNLKKVVENAKSELDDELAALERKIKHLKKEKKELENELIKKYKKRITELKKQTIK